MSLNDPQWGKRGRSGPPDLDEIWRNVNRRLNEMFGRTTPPGGVRAASKDSDSAAAAFRNSS